MNDDALESIKDIFLNCMEEVYNSSVVHDYDDGDYFSHKGWLEDADNLPDLSEAFNTWVAQVEGSNE